MEATDKFLQEPRLGNTIRLTPRYSSADTFKPNQSFSFLNFSSLGSVITQIDKNRNISFFCDGILTSAFFSCILGQRIARVSFDFSSIAHSIFEHAALTNKRVYFVGASESECASFAKKISQRYPQLTANYRNGFWSPEEAEDVSMSILKWKPDMVVAGLGAGRQEAFLQLLRAVGFTGTGFTCGGFIRQESASMVSSYYPDFVNKLNLRAFYRMINEPHTIKRYFIDYPKNLILISSLLILRKVRLELS